jgi:hypothetical protein
LRECGGQGQAAEEDGGDPHGGSMFTVLDVLWWFSQQRAWSPFMCLAFQIAG